MQHILWLTLRAARHPYVMMNDDIRAAAAADPSVTVVDWNVYSRSHPEWFQPDGIHLAGDGAQAMATLMHTWLVELKIAPAPLTVGTRRLPSARVAQRYSTLLAAAGGTPPYRWTPVSLPAGFSLTPSGSLTGRPEARPAELHLTVRVTDATGARAARALVLRVRSAYMLFPTTTFAIFFVIVLPTSWLLMRRRALWQAFMLIASYVFYAWWDWRFVFLLAASTVGNHVAARAIHGRRRGVATQKLLLALAVAFNLGAARLLQVRRLPRLVGRERPDPARAAVQHVGALGDAADRHLVLHVHGAVVRDRRLPRRARAGRLPAVRRLPLVLPAPRRRPDRPRQRAAAAARAPAQRGARRTRRAPTS